MATRADSDAETNIGGASSGTAVVAARRWRTPRSTRPCPATAAARAFSGAAVNVQWPTGAAGPAAPGMTADGEGRQRRGVGRARRAVPGAESARKVRFDAVRLTANHVVVRLASSDEPERVEHGRVAKIEFGPGPTDRAGVGRLLRRAEGSASCDCLAPAIPHRRRPCHLVGRPRSPRGLAPSSEFDDHTKHPWPSGTVGNLAAAKVGNHSVSTVWIHHAPLSRPRGLGVIDSDPAPIVVGRHAGNPAPDDMGTAMRDVRNVARTRSPTTVIPS
jgi:hypothetical protein